MYKGELKVTVIKASLTPAKEKEKLSPYVNCRVLNVRTGSKTKKQRTIVTKGTNPQWGAVFTFPLCDFSNEVLGILIPLLVSS